MPDIFAIERLISRSSLNSRRFRKIPVTRAEDLDCFIDYAIGRALIELACHIRRLGLQAIDIFGYTVT
jgi:hypothetical protein